MDAVTQKKLKFLENHQPRHSTYKKDAKPSQKPIPSK